MIAWQWCTHISAGDVAEQEVEVDDVEVLNEGLEGRRPLDIQARAQVGRDLQEAQEDLQLVPVKYKTSG